MGIHSELHLFGMPEGALYLSDFNGHDEILTEEEQAKIEEIIAGDQRRLPGRGRHLCSKSTFDQ